VRELLPELRLGKVTRGRIGVRIGEVPREAIDELGLSERTGALVGSVEENSAAGRAGVEPGDVILAFNGAPVTNSNELVQTVTRTKPGTTVQVRVMRDGQERTLNLTVDELDLEAENPTRADPRRAQGAEPPPQTSDAFGIEISNVTPELARSLRLGDARGALITQVAPESPAARHGLRRGDLIVRVGTVTITSAAEAQRELGRVPAGGTALMRIVRGGQETFLPVTKE
jgi:serine protease Do